MKILVTGGCGYIGSHTVVELLDAEYEVVIVDNLSNSSEKILKRIEKITKRLPAFYNIDILNDSELGRVFDKTKVDAIIHFAALKSVKESTEKPLDYYQNNLGGTLSLLRCMESHAVKKLIFSSSATVYGEPKAVPIKESAATGQKLANPYGWTKFMCEQIISDYAAANPDFQATILRYFNPIGAHKSGLIGEDPKDIPNNLVPYVSKVAVGELNELTVFGDDYPTPDGTGVRDYIHVVDLAKGHLAALKHTSKSGQPDIYNLGTGKGVSVLEIVQAFEKASGRNIPYKINSRRSGDIAEYFADPTKAREELQWKAEKELADMCQDAWRWQSNNPKGCDT